jgi:hypothetical protein
MATRATALTLPVYGPNHGLSDPTAIVLLNPAILTILLQRGGAGNIGSPMVRPTSKTPHDSEMIPELAVRNSSDEIYHVGVRKRDRFHFLIL